ncbi:uncharacterized protein LOC121595862 [Anopheles merus]|uniref:uncharacterized protein LOC121595862 n=1 Tax=Anopheles merus TaxID=30066 RepID=UPI001BE40459|nr:uncharacterized protein LOC121595862 [Anopheles merus]
MRFGWGERHPERQPDSSGTFKLVAAVAAEAAAGVASAREPVFGSVFCENCNKQPGQLRSSARAEWLCKTLTHSPGSDRVTFRWRREDDGKHDGETIFTLRFVRTAPHHNSPTAATATVGSVKKHRGPEISSSFCLQDAHRKCQPSRSRSAAATGRREALTHTHTQ